MIPPQLIKPTQWIIESYQHFFSTSIFKEFKIEVEKSLEHQLYYANIALLATNTNKQFIYMNKFSQNLWEISLDKALQMKGKQTARVQDQKQRDILLKEVQKKGFIKNYSGIRISSKGKLFYIKSARVWNLIDKQKNFKGQAACFKQFDYIENESK